MGRPVNKRYFGVDGNGNFKVHFHNGTKVVDGVIVAQKGSHTFICKDRIGNKVRCNLVPKRAADLQRGEMSIAGKLDDNSLVHPMKIEGRLAIVNGFQVPWTFVASNSDLYVQVDEAGTNSSFDGSTDLEGDDLLSIAVAASAPLLLLLAIEIDDDKLIAYFGARPVDVRTGANRNSAGDPCQAVVP